MRSGRPGRTRSRARWRQPFIGGRTRRSAPIDTSTLLMALEHHDPDVSYYLDLETGEIEFISEGYGGAVAEAARMVGRRSPASICSAHDEG